MTNWTSCEGEDGYPSFVGHDKAAVMYRQEEVAVMCRGTRWTSCVRQDEMAVKWRAGEGGLVT